MGLNDTASGERLHIGFFGLRNAGKSSVVNAVTGQSLSLVSEIAGTTTDPVKKAMELLPLGPVVIIDTAGTDDEGMLGEMRVKKTMDILSITDIAVLVTEADTVLSENETELINLFKQKNIPYIVVYNKADIRKKEHLKDNEISVSAKTGYNINELKNLLGTLAKNTENKKRIIGDFLKKDDIAVLVVPVDAAAPKGRLILPQQQTIRDILDSDASSIVTKPDSLENTLQALKKPPKIVITDSQVFDYVSKIVPEDIPLTSFSILFARYKGDLQKAVNGAFFIDKLKSGDTVLISEGCTHHRQCGDIGTEKLPALIKKYTKKNINFEFSSGTQFCENIKKYALIIHCGGCMLNETEMKSRINKAFENGVPVTNYGTAIAHMNGILKRSIKLFDFEINN